MLKTPFGKNEIKKIVKSGHYELAVSAELERQAEKISLSALEKTLLEGKIIRKFPEGPRGPSFLIERKSARENIHCMCAPLKNQMRILAVYRPSRPKWFKPKER